MSPPFGTSSCRGCDREPTRWHFQFPHDHYVGECDGHRWSLAAADPQVPAEITITATVEAFTRFLFVPAGTTEVDVAITGGAEAIQRFRRLTGAIADVVGQP